MKIQAILFCLLFLFGCATSKDVENDEVSVVENPIETSEMQEEMLHGIVRLHEGACPVLIEILEDGKVTSRAYPVALADSLKQEGKEIYFTYNTSRAMQPEGCSADLTLVVTRIIQMK